MRHSENRHFILKGIVALVVIFMVVVAFVDFTPAQQPVEKTVVYGQK